LISPLHGKWLTESAVLIALLSAAPIAAAIEMAPAGQSPVGINEGFAGVVERTVNGVVTIASPRAEGFGEEFVERPPAAQYRGMAVLGSGVIVTPDGHILTNHHVINGASDIRVLLSDDRQFEAKLVGTDSDTDVALLKIDAMGLAALTIGNSASVRAGDFALAIGAPLGLRHTVTLGIVSATNRNGLGIHPSEGLIQTDAALNPGSSGGALINARGELIGIITAGKEYAGVGFAVPVDTAHYVMQQIARHGRVIRASLAATIQRVTPAIARAFGMTGELRGALVAAVVSGTSVERAGLLPGDIILAVDGYIVRDEDDLKLVIGQKTPGTEVRLTASRHGAEVTLTVTLVEDDARKPADKKVHSLRLSGPLGLSVHTMTKDIADDLDIPPHTRGVVVTEVERASRAAAAQLAEGDIILEIARQPVATDEEFIAALAASENQPVLLLVLRAGVRRFVVVE
jgi:serine protease Do